MNDDASSFTFASIGDLHVKDGQSGSLRELFEAISKSAGALVLCGDLTDTGTPAQAEILAKELRVCSVPVIGVLGNHDYESGHADEVKRILCDVGVHLLDGQAAEVNGVAFIGVKGFAGGFGPRMLSSFGEPAIKTFVAEAMNEAMRLENIMTDIGTGSYTIIAQTAAEMMGVPLEKVVVRLGDSTFPVSAGSGGQWGGNNSTAGVYAACVKLREEVAQKLGFNSAEAEFADGEVRAGNRRAPLAQAASEGSLSVEDGIEYGDLAKKQQQSTFGAHFVEVGVDAATAEIRVRRMELAAH